MNSARMLPPGRRMVAPIFLGVAAGALAAIVLWSAFTSGGVPDPTLPTQSRSAAALDTAILVFREGLEAVLVLAALTTSLLRTRRDSWKPVVMGAGCALLATAVTWLIVTAAVDHIDATPLHIQAATGLLAILVLLVIMNWFFHRIYWAGWIQLHEHRKGGLVRRFEAGQPSAFWGLVLLGLTAMYREGFEVVLFLQSLRLRAGNHTIAVGTAVGIALTGVVAFLTFVAQRRLPYRSMLVATGIMLGAVLLVMVGESAQELQLAGWMSSTPVTLPIPGWVEVWFATYPTAEGLGAQGAAAFIVFGSYSWAQRRT